MNIYSHNVPPSRIIEIGNKITQLSLETGEEYLALNRGVNAVSPIDINSVVKELDLNTGGIHNYPVSHGSLEFKEAIIREYFDDYTTPDMIAVTAGAISAIDLVLRTFKPTKVHLPAFFWGPYKSLAELNSHSIEYYRDLSQEFSRDDIVIICDPNNPTGAKMDDKELFENMQRITTNGTTILFDSPYRRMRRGVEDNFFKRISRIPNLLIIESFSKSLGMPGMRIAFIRTNAEHLLSEIKIRLTYGFGGVNQLAQQVVTYLLSTTEGKEIVHQFKTETNKQIIKNINWLSDNGLLEESLYTEAPDGIFAIINRSEEHMMLNRIGAVTMEFFTELPDLKSRYGKCSRICVSVPHTKFLKYFNKLI